MRRLALLAALLLAPSLAHSQFIDGLPVVGVPPAPALSASDLVMVCQAGTAGRPGTCTPRQTTAGALAGVIPGLTLSSPPPIGNVVPNTGAFTTGTFSTLNVTAGGTLAGTFAQGNPFFDASQTVAGAVANSMRWRTAITGTATGNPALRYSAYLGTISSDTLALPAVNQFFNGWQYQHNFGGAAETGNRQAMQITLSQTATTGNTIASGTSGFYVALDAQSQSSVPDNGTGLTNTTAHGRLFGMNPAAVANTGATNLYQVTGIEANAEIATGASAFIRNMISVAALNGPTQGTRVDAGIWFYKDGVAAGLKDGILFGGAGANNWPIDAAGTIIGIDNNGVAATATNGVDFSAATLTGAFLKGPSSRFAVDGPTGAITAPSLASATTLALQPGGGATTVGGSVDSASTVRGQTGLLAGTNSIVGLVTVNGAAGQQRSMVFDTAGVQRMRIGIDNTAESGSNAGSVPFINVATDAGAATRAWSVDRNTTQSLMPRLKLGQSFVYAGGAANNDTAALNISANYSGSTDGAAWVNLNGMTINSDTLNPGANQQAIGFNIAHNVGGTGVGGNRSALRVQITSIGAFPSHSLFQGVLSSVTMQHSSGGTDVWENAAGVVFGGGTYGQLFSGATNWRGVVGHEIDYGIYAGATAAGITGFQIIRWAGHAYSPPNPEGDNVLVLGSQGATNGAKTAIQIGSYNGYTGIDPTGKIMDVVMSVLGDHTFPMGHGLDLKLPTFAATAFRSKGFSVLGDGSVQVGTAYLSSDASGSSLDAKGSYVSAAAVATGGVNLHTNEMLIDDVTGTVLSITATDNGSGPGAVTAVGIYRVGYSLSPPANPVTFRVVGYALGNGMGQPTAPTINLTWTAQNALAIQPTAAGKLGFYGATPIVKATPIGACAGSTGCQALRDALANLGLINAGSISN